MTEKYLNDLARELVSKAIEEGENHGLIGVFDDETDTEHIIDWEVKIIVEYNG